VATVEAAAATAPQDERLATPVFPGALLLLDDDLVNLQRKQ
jgi:hypothetical protein